MRVTSGLHYVDGEPRFSARFNSAGDTHWIELQFGDDKGSHVLTVFCERAQDAVAFAATIADKIHHEIQQLPCVANV